MADFVCGPVVTSPPPGVTGLEGLAGKVAGPIGAFFEVKPSAVKAGGLGLFTRVPLRPGSVVCYYSGDVFKLREGMVRADHSYLMRMGAIYVDAIDHPEVLARYINDCRNPMG